MSQNLWGILVGSASVVLVCGTLIQSLEWPANSKPSRMYSFVGFLALLVEVIVISKGGMSRSSWTMDQEEIILVTHFFPDIGWRWFWKKWICWKWWLRGHQIHKCMCPFHWTVGTIVVEWALKCSPTSSNVDIENLLTEEWELSHWLEYYLGGKWCDKNNKSVIYTSITRRILMIAKIKWENIMQLSTHIVPRHSGDTKATHLTHT